MKNTLLVLLFSIGAAGLAQAAPQRVEVRHLNGFSAVDQAKAYRSVALLEKVLNSPEFQLRVLHFSWNGQEQFADNGGLTNQQVLAKLLDRPVELDVTLYSAPIWKRLLLKDGVVGHTGPGTPRTWINRKFFRRFTAADIAGNFAHEWLHKLGFDHDFNRTLKRPYSVPYGIGELVSELASGPGL